MRLTDKSGSYVEDSQSLAFAVYLKGVQPAGPPKAGAGTAWRPRTCEFVGLNAREFTMEKATSMSGDTFIRHAGWACGCRAVKWWKWPREAPSEDPTRLCHPSPCRRWTTSHVLL